MNKWIKSFIIFLIEIIFLITYLCTQAYDTIWAVWMLVYFSMGVFLVVSFGLIRQKISDKYNPTKKEMKTVFTAIAFLKKNNDVPTLCKLEENIFLMVGLICVAIFHFCSTLFIHILLGLLN